MNDAPAAGDGAAGGGPPKTAGRTPTLDHPGGSGAVLGMRLLRYSGVQGVSLVLSNVLQLGAIVVVANFLGAAELARYSLLFFLAGVVGLLFSLPSKPGTVRRVFGAGDDDDDDDDEDDRMVSSSPKRSLGVGLAWAAVLGLLAAALVIVLREPLAELLLSDRDDANLIVWAGIAGGALVIVRVASITLWLERRPAAFVIGDSSRAAIGVTVLTILLAAGSGLEGAVIGMAVGCLAAAAICSVLLVGSFEPSFDLREVGEIVKLGRDRAPVVVSFWMMSNADIFILSRFVDLTDLGVYNFASRLGFLCSFAPQGFRVAMRPLRKSAAFQAVRREYGHAVARGQLLGYFLLICIVGVLAMVMLSEVVVDLAPESFAESADVDPASVIPITAAAFVMAPLFRTMNGQTSWETKRRRVFVIGVVLACLLFFGITAALAPAIGVYAAPVGILAGCGLPIAYMFVRDRRGDRPMEFPFREVTTALVLAAAFAAGRLLLPAMGAVADIAVAVAGMAAYLGLLFVLRVIPENHWAPLTQMVRSSISGRPDSFRPKPGVRALEPGERAELREALALRLAPDVLAGRPRGRDPSRGADDQRPPDSFTEAIRLVRMLRVVGRAGGINLKPRTKHDAEIAELVFVDEPTAVRNATLNKLMSRGADAGDLRALEDVAARLSGLGDRFWSGSEQGAHEPRS